MGALRMFDRALDEVCVGTFMTALLIGECQSSTM